jgi:hypothetical protein
MIHLHGIQYPTHHESSTDDDDGRVLPDYQVKWFHLLPNFGHDQDLRVQPIAYIQGIDRFDLVQSENQ